MTRQNASCRGVRGRLLWHALCSCLTGCFTVSATGGAGGAGGTGGTATSTAGTHSSGSGVGAGAQLDVTSSHESSGTLVGGQGGGPFDTMCSPGDVVVGLFGWDDNNVVDAMLVHSIGIECARVNVSPVGNGYRVDLVSSGKLQQVGHLGAWPGGRFTDAPCPAGTAISAVAIEAHPAGYIRSFSAVCSTPRIEVTSGGVEVVVGTADPHKIELGAPSRVMPTSCSDRGWLVGLHGRFGETIDAAGMTCAGILASR